MSSEWSDLSDGEENDGYIFRRPAVMYGMAGFCCDLPLPFAKGKPRDYCSMSPEELRKFIQFSYHSVFKKHLPVSEKSKQKIPGWWPAFVTFDKSLKVVVIQVNGRKKVETERKELKGLLEAFYDGFGMTILLRVAQLLSDPDNLEMRFLQGKPREPSRIETTDGKLLFLIDYSTTAYDLADVKKASIKEVENFVPCDALDTLKQIGMSDKALKPLLLKRRLFDQEEEIQETFSCQYCKREFKVIDFRDDHETECLQGPRRRDTQNNFMLALGLQNPPTSDSKKHASTGKPCSALKAPSSSPQRGMKRALRKLPKRNLLLSLVRNHPIPLTSERGQRRIKDLGEIVEHTYPPSYEKYCQSKACFGRRESSKPYQNVTKKIIEKNGENPHVYSYGRRQRVRRNQELVIGLNSRSWKLLNKCKKARLVLEKVQVTDTPVKVEAQMKRSYLEDKLKGALVLPRVKLSDLKKCPTPRVKSVKSLPNPRVKLVDILKYPTPEAAKYLTKYKSKK